MSLPFRPLTFLGRHMTAEQQAALLERIADLRSGSVMVLPAGMEVGFQEPRFGVDYPGVAVQAFVTDCHERWCVKFRNRDSLVGAGLIEWVTEKMEPGEDRYSALNRGVEEELGFTPQSTLQLPGYTAFHLTPDGERAHVEMLPFIVRCREGQAWNAEPDRSDGILWLTRYGLHDLPPADCFPSLHYTVERYWHDLVLTETRRSGEDPAFALGPSCVLRCNAKPLICDWRIE